MYSLGGYSEDNNDKKRFYDTLYSLMLATKEEYYEAVVSNGRALLESLQQTHDREEIILIMELHTTSSSEERLKGFKYPLSEFQKKVLIDINQDVSQYIIDTLSSPWRQR